MDEGDDDDSFGFESGNKQQDFGQSKFSGGQMGNQQQKPFADFKQPPQNFGQINDPFAVQQNPNNRVQNDQFDAFGNPAQNQQKGFGFGNQPNQGGRNQSPFNNPKVDPFGNQINTPQRPNPNQQSQKPPNDPFGGFGNNAPAQSNNPWSNFSMNQKPPGQPQTNNNQGFGNQTSKPQSNDPFDFQPSKQAPTNQQANPWNNFQVNPQNNRQPPKSPFDNQEQGGQPEHFNDPFGGNFNAKPVVKDPFANPAQTGTPQRTPPQGFQNQPNQTPPPGQNIWSGFQVPQQTNQGQKAPPQMNQTPNANFQNPNLQRPPQNNQFPNQTNQTRNDQFGFSQQPPPKQQVQPQFNQQQFGQPQQQQFAQPQQQQFAQQPQQFAQPPQQPTQQQFNQQQFNQQQFTQQQPIQQPQFNQEQPFDSHTQPSHNDPQPPESFTPSTENPNSDFNQWNQTVPPNPTEGHFDQHPQNTEYVNEPINHPPTSPFDNNHPADANQTQPKESNPPLAENPFDEPKNEVVEEMKQLTLNNNQSNPL